MTEIKVPTLGESVSEATVASWLKKEGDSVKADEPIVELETDKVTLVESVRVVRQMMENRPQPKKKKKKGHLLPLLKQMLPNLQPLLLCAR